MPITRKKRATPPEQSATITPPTEMDENTSTTSATPEQTQAESVQTTPEQVSPLLTEPVTVNDTVRESAPVEPVVSPSTPTSPVLPSIPSTPPTLPTTRVPSGERSERHTTERQNGDRQERQGIERQNGDRQETPIESGRRTARGELFRRPPQAPQAASTTTVAPPIQPPSHEISLPLGNLLHLSYNPGYTGSDEARSQLLELLAQESKKGGRARCWNCGSIAIVYERWNTRSRTFGEVGIAFCEICGVWSVM